MGYYYFNGKGGVDKDEKEAIKYFTLAAESGVAHAQSFLGWCYEQGQNVQQDYTQAFHWYHRAAVQDEAPASWYPTGYFYYHGKGTSRNYKKAVYWLQKAAENEDEQAMHLLGLCYHYGVGVEHDSQVALKWLQKAADNSKGWHHEIKTDYANIVEFYRPPKCTKEESQAQ